MEPQRSEVVFNPNDPGFVKNPYPIYAALREHDPVHRSPLGPWVITRYDDILEILGDSRLSNAPSPYAVIADRNRGRYLCADIAHNIIPFMDAPRQTAARRQLSEAFRARLAQRPPDARGVARQLIDAATSLGELNLIGDFGTPLSEAVIGLLMGIPESDRKQLKSWSEMFFYLFVPIPSREILEQMEENLALYRSYFARLIEARRQSPKDDLISDLASRDPGEDPDWVNALADTCMLLYSDGVENIDSAIGNATIALLDHPDQMRRLRTNPHLIDRAVDECLRYDPPAQFIARIATETLSLSGRTIRKGEAVLLALAAGNRDPERFDAPDQLDIEREGSPHLSFGRGRHFCVGAQLARMQIAAGLEAIVQNLSGLQLREPRIRRVPRFGHRWLESLYVTFDPA